MEMRALVILGQAEEEKTSLAGSAGMVARPLCEWFVWVICESVSICGDGTIVRCMMCV